MKVWKLAGFAFGERSWRFASVLTLTAGALTQPVAQEFGITDIGMGPQGEITLQHESDPGRYFLLLGGTELTNIRRTIDLALPTGGPGILTDLEPPTGTAFYQVLAVPLTAPFDSDADGIDDVFELTHDFLDPFDPSDRLADFDGDGRTNLEEYRDGTDPAVADPPGLTFITQTSPADGEGEVAVTRETVVRFSNPLADSITIGPDELFAEYGDRRLRSRIALAGDRRKVTLFYLEPLPGGARVQVTLDADDILDVFGNALDADGDGVAGGAASIEFQTHSLALFPGTAVCGRVFASELAPAGNGEISVNVPLQGVTITVDGMEETMRTVTDQNGDFRLAPAPAGRFFVHIDGRTATNSTPTTRYPQGPYYPFVGKAWESVPGEEVNIGEVYLPLVKEGTLQLVSADVETQVRFPEAVLQEHPELAGVTVNVPPNSLFADNGTPGGRVGIAPVPPDRLPGPLPLGMNPSLVITVQTDGPSNFDRPAPVCFPNLPDPVTGQVLPPGAKSALMSFNHDTGRFEVAGSMTVSADGLLVCTDPGVGIPAPGWHANDPQCSGSGGEVGEQTEEEEEAESDRSMPEPTGTQEPTHEDDCPADAACRTSNTVFLHNGEEVFERVDLRIPGRGEVHFEMRRTYRSQLDFNGPIGHGWNYNYNEALFVQENGDVIRANGGSHVDTWTHNADGTYQAPAGYYSTLRQRADGTFILRKPDGFQHFYRADGRLFCLQDRHGNQMLFDYDARGNLDVVVDPFGREIEFVFETFPDGRDRLVRVIDFIGREMVYNYDDHFDLFTVRTPIITGTSTENDFPEGRTERYAYSSGFDEPELNHNLLSVTYPEEVDNGGPPALVWTYGEDPNDPVTFDRVLNEAEGGTNASGVAAGGTMSFQYEMLNQEVAPGNLEIPRGKVTITERNGNVFEYYANELHHHIMTRRLMRGFRPDEPAFYETRSEYDADGQLLRRILPEGNEIRYRYDSVGPRAAHRNLVEVRRVADPDRGGGEDLVTTFTYEPLYNQVASITDPRGNATDFEPPVAADGVDRYTTRYFYDYQESNDPVEQAVELGVDLSGIARGLGDLNGDGRTNQTAGNQIRIEEPAVHLLPQSNEAERLGGTEQPVVAQFQWNDRGQRIAIIDAEGNVDEYRYYPENDPDGDGRAHRPAYLAVSSSPTGYLRARIIDAAESPRRTSDVPPVALETVYRYDAVGNIVAVRDPRGVESEIEVNQLNEPVVVVRGADVSEALASGQLLLEETPFAYRTRLFYNFNGRIVRTEIENRDSTTEGVGEFVDRTSTYDILNNRVESTVEIDADTVLITQYRYDENDLPTLVVQPEGNRGLVEYDERNLPFRVTRGFEDPDAATIQINYDLNANRAEIVDAEDNDGDGLPEVTTFVYDGFDRLTESIDALGNRSVREYDVASNLVRSRVFGHPAGDTKAENVLLQDVHYSHDELNRVFQMNEALFVSDGFEPMRAPDLRDENGDGFVSTLLEYDALSRPTFIIEDDLETTETIYDGADRSVEVVDHLGNRLVTDYDRNLNPVRVQSVELSPEGLAPDEIFTTHYVYDQLDRLVRMTDNAGQTTRFAYDSRDNLVSRSDGQGPLFQDPLGLFSDQLNEPGNTVTWFYDGLDRRILQVADLRVDGQGGTELDRSNPFNPDGQIDLGYEYDGNSRLVGIVDDNGNRTRFEYDALDRRTGQINADNEMFESVYDRDDNVRRVTDPNGTVRQYTFDALNRPARVAVERAPGVAGTTEVTYEYDGLSRRTRSVDNNGAAATAQTCEYVYDSLSRILEERQNGQPVSTVWSGDSKRLRCVYPGGRTIDLTYDAIDRAKTVSDQRGLIGACFWIGPGLRELRRNYANDTMLSFLDDAGVEDIGYDAVRRITRLRHLLPDRTALADRQYGYNRAGMRTFERRNEHGGLTDRYIYDSTYRIVRTELDRPAAAPAANGPRTAWASASRPADEPSGNAADSKWAAGPVAPQAVTPRDLQTIGYLYDGVGNRREVEQTSTSSGLSTASFTVNVMNEYDAIAGALRVHDDNGNLTDDGTRLMVYDSKNRLTQVRDKATDNRIAEYFYLADNRRTRKVVHGPNPKITDFLYDGWQVVEERNGELGTTEVTYVYGATYIDEPIQMLRTADHPLGSGAFFYHQNARYDVIALTDDTGAVAEQVLYDDFGNSMILTPDGDITASGPAPSEGAFDEVSNQQSAQKKNVRMNRASVISNLKSTIGNPYLFQGARCDGETGFYYFRNRYYDSRFGRFLQRDPVWDDLNVGGWYTFVAGRAVSLLDPFGLDNDFSGHTNEELQARFMSRIAEAIRVDSERAFGEALPDDWKPPGELLEYLLAYRKKSGTPTEEIWMIAEELRKRIIAGTLCLPDTPLMERLKRAKELKRQKLIQDLEARFIFSGQFGLSEFSASELVALHQLGHLTLYDLEKEAALRSKESEAWQKESVKLPPTVWAEGSGKPLGPTVNIPIFGGAGVELPKTQQDIRENIEPLLKYIERVESEESNGIKEIIL